SSRVIRLIRSLMRSSVERSGFWYGYGEIENILKTAGFILFFLKKIAHSPAKFQKVAEKVGFRVGKPPKNGWTTL
uniref:hypothetical protein n=1 Tax=Gemmiger formicilis TaxID=745368 RepID=UPI003FEFBA3A